MKKFSKLFTLLLVITLATSLLVMLSGCNDDDTDPANDITASYLLETEEYSSTLVLNETKSSFSITTGKAVIDGTYTSAVKGYANLYYKNFLNGVAENLYSTVNLTTSENGNTFKVVATGNSDDNYGIRTVVDKSNKSVTITGEVTKIINLWPAGTGSFYALGAADLLIGTATASANEWTSFFYEDASSIPVLGGIDPSVENIANLNPDLVIVHPSNASTLQPQLEAVGIPAININFSDYDSMKSSYTILATVLGGVFKNKLESWCAQVDEDLAYVRNLTANLADDKKPIVYYIAGQSYTNDTQLLTTTFSGSGLTNIMKDWCESAGGKWASSLMNLESTSATAEAVFAINPDVIICGGTYQHVSIDRLKKLDGWKNLNAVTNEKIYNDPYVCFNWERFGLEALLQIKYALTVIHPELCVGENAIDMVAEVKGFYEKYAGVILTDTQAQYILDGKTPNGVVLANNSI